jgi:TolB protein
VQPNGQLRANLATYSSDAAWAPDGRSIVVSNDDGDIYTANIGTQQEHQVTSTDAWEWQPDWCPIGNKLAFVSDRSGEDQIYLSTIDGRQVRRLTFKGTNNNPAWSPDGRRIAFDSDRNGRIQLFVMRAEGLRQQLLTKFGNATSPAWAPDGKRIAFASDRNGRWAIYVAQADGTNAHRITNPGYGEDDDVPTWSPDGRRIAFGRSLEDSVGLIEVVPADGGTPRVIVHPQAPASEPDWRP